MPTLKGIVPHQPGPTLPCRWCGAETDIVLTPPGSRIGPVPMHMLCGALFIRAYGKWRAGRALMPLEVEGLARFEQRRLSD